jgi:hypothetical protein
MLIVALVMAIIGLAALVTAVVTSNEVIAWVCIGASVIGVVLLIIDAVRERQRRDAGQAPASEPPASSPASEAPTETFEYPEDQPDEAASGESEAATQETPTEADSGDSGRRNG